MTLVASEFAYRVNRRYYITGRADAKGYRFVTPPRCRKPKRVPIMVPGVGLSSRKGGPQVITAVFFPMLGENQVVRWTYAAATRRDRDERRMLAQVENLVRW